MQAGVPGAHSKHPTRFLLWQRAKGIAHHPCRRAADRAHAADLHACAEPFDDSAWLVNSSSPSLSAGEWDKTPLPAHSPIFLSNLPLLGHV